MSNPPATIPADKLAFYEKLVATNPHVDRKGAALPYTSVNGHMFSVLTPAGKLALRLGADERESFLKRFRTQLCQQHGTILKEYVEVPDSLLKKTAELKEFFDQSYAYASALPPKPSKKLKPAAKKPAALKSASQKQAAK
jgi:TfoX/Sxy family transcriptional regulator of competence genes